MGINYKKLIDEILNDSSLNATEIHKSLMTRVYLLNQDPKLIVKFDKQDMEQIRFDKRLLDALDRGDDLTSLIYYISSVTIEGDPYVCTVSKHLRGQSLANYPTDMQITVIMKAVHEFTQRMHAASDQFRDSKIPNVKEVLLHYHNLVPPCFLKSKLTELLKIPEFNEILDSPEQYLFHGDLWRENILLGDNHVSIIDLTPVFYGPKQMQVANLFSAYFKLNSVLLGKEEVFQLESLIQEWPTPLDRKELLYLMYIFPIGIGFGKELSFIDSPVTEEQYKEIMNPLHTIIHMVDDELRIEL